MMKKIFPRRQNNDTMVKIINFSQELSFVRKTIITLQKKLP